MAKASTPEPTTRAYTLKLSGEDDWREILWTTHVTVNRAARVWGDWLLTLRGGLPPSLADDDSILPITASVVDKEAKRRKLKGEAKAALRLELERERGENLKVLLALSWLSVESPASLAPESHIVAKAGDPGEQVMDRFRSILDRRHVDDPQAWLDACEPALTARIRDDAVWVDRAGAFADLQKRLPGLSPEWARTTLFEFLGGEDEYFTMPESGTPASTEAKDFVQKAGGWLSRNWGAGEKSDSAAIATRLELLAHADPGTLVGIAGTTALSVLLATLEQDPPADADSAALFKDLKRAVGWKGRSSKGAIALEKIRDANSVSAELWEQTVVKLLEEASDRQARAANTFVRPAWMGEWREQIELQLGMAYRVGKDLIWEHGVALDHALRRVSAGHTWIKRAEAERRRFREDARRIERVRQAARDWLDAFCEKRSADSGALTDYFIRKRAIDGWEKIVRVWDDLGSDSTRRERIEAARNVQANLENDEKFGDIQLFAGFGDEEEDEPRPCLADDEAACVWRDEKGCPEAGILKDYVAATQAKYNERRFKVPAYRHPDPLRHPVYVDFGNSRWGITYSVLKAAQERVALANRLAKAKNDRTREKLEKQLAASPDLRNVRLSAWNGEQIVPLPLRWAGRRFWNDLDLPHLLDAAPRESVSRADRLGRLDSVKGVGGAVDVAGVFEQKDWNGRLQIPRSQLDRLADVVYGKRAEPDYSKLAGLRAGARAAKLWQRLDWFLTTSAKLTPQGPWLDYVAGGLPEGIEYKTRRNGNYLNYAANKGRKGRARLQLARLPGLRILSLDLGHRYAAACAVWETITGEQMAEACRQAGRPEPAEADLYVHIQRATDKLQESGRRKGQPVVETTIYRRVGPDSLPDDCAHAAPWARLERQFLIKLQGEDRPTRAASAAEIARVNEFRRFLGLADTSETPRIDELHAETVQIARFGLRRLGDAARIAYSMTALKKPISGGRDEKLDADQRIEFVLDALLRWQELAASTRYRDDWAGQLWHTWIKEKLGGPQAVEIAEGDSPPKRKKRSRETREALRPVARQLADPKSNAARQLCRIWSEEWANRETQWRKHLRRLRRFVLPGRADWHDDPTTVRHLGGLSTKRLKTIRDLYQVLRSFRMRPEPDDLRANVPELGDDSLAKFGRRILNQLERLREQRIKQLASRVVEAALGAGRMTNRKGRDRRRPQKRIDRACHAVVVENLEFYRPEESRLRRENRQLMDWAARNARKYIVEGCQLHGLHFVEVAPGYTSKQDSRTGAPGIRCEDVPRNVLQEAAGRVRFGDAASEGPAIPSAETRLDRQVRWWAREFGRLRARSGPDLKSRDQILKAMLDRIAQLPAERSTIRLPRRGGELFVSANPNSPAARGIQADLNAAANIGLRALTDPDWEGAWWFVLAELPSGQIVQEKIDGCPYWKAASAVLPIQHVPTGDKQAKKSRAYAWNPRHWTENSTAAWQVTNDYWREVERVVAERLRREQLEPENPF